MDGRQRRLINLEGRVFGFLEVRKRATVKGVRPVKWNCICMCGTACVVVGDSLRRRSTTSCGCFKRAKAITHGQSNTRLYRIWSLMKDRCDNPRQPTEKYYFDKQIKYANDWKYFVNFFERALVSGYADNLELDRRDCNKGYSPENCRWVDMYEQAYNKGIYSSNTSGVAGVTWIERDGVWSARISHKGVRKFLGNFTTKEEAIEVRRKAELEIYGGYK